MACVVLGIGCLAALGVHQSSVGIGLFQDDGQRSEDVIAGWPRWIRSDEFARSTPLVLGQQITQSGDFTTPLGEDPTLTTGVVTGGFFERIVFLDRTLVQSLGFLPAATVFAMNWWLMIAILLVAVPLLLRVWGLPLGLNALVTAGVFLNPAVFWWSFFPVQPIALSAVVALCIAAAWKLKGRSRVIAAVAATVLGALALARLPFAYFPFAFPIAASIVLPTAFMGLATRENRRVTLVVSSAILVLGATLALLVIAQNSEAWEAFSSTVYPGSRSDGGLLENFGKVFGASFLGILIGNPEIVSYNQSEVSSAWALAGFASLMVLAALPAGSASTRDKALGRTLATVSLVGFSWILFTWPSWAASIPLLSLVPPFRMSGVIGIAATLLLGVSLARLWRVQEAGEARQATLPIALGSGLLLLLLAAGTYLKQTLIPGLTIGAIFLAAAYSSISVALLTVSKAGVRYVGIALCVVGMFAIVFRVNPVMMGMGDLRDGNSAQFVRDVARSGNPQYPYWAAETQPINALLEANGIPTLSGNQWTGPSPLWESLDPTRQYEQAWNRGAAAIFFDWDEKAKAIAITSPSNDAIIINANPCSPELREIGLGHIVSDKNLAAPCLKKLGEVKRGGSFSNVYQVN